MSQPLKKVSGSEPGLGLLEAQPQGHAIHLRPTPEGAAWLRAALIRSRLFLNPPPNVAVEEHPPADRIRFPPTDRSPLTFHTAPAAVEVTIDPAAPAHCTFDLAHLGELLAVGPPACYRLTRDSLSQALQWDYTFADATLLLTRYAGAPLPPAVAEQLHAWRAATTTIPCQPGYRLTLPDRAALRALRRRALFRRRTRPLASGHEVWVDQADAPDLWRYLRRIGYQLHVPPPDSRQTAGRRPPLPLVQWLALLHTYQALRQRVPGLADLDVAGLIAAAAATLSPDERAAAEQLLSSQLALIDRVVDGRQETVDGEGEQESRLVHRLETAIQSDAALTLAYIDTHGQLTRRRVRPLRLEQRWGQTYLLAFCELRQDERHFRLDRIVEIGY